MAYATYLASVSQEQVHRLSSDGSHKLRHDALVTVSH
jgi:hypothetical protein